MSIGKISLIGQFGDSTDPKTGATIKGISVADVATQIAGQPNCEKYEVLINSPGGNVSIGTDIAGMIGKLPNCHTYASELCASIATLPFISVPVENRHVYEGTAFMVHNPLLDGVTGNASELMAMAAFLEPIQEDLLKAYVKATGADKSILKTLMKDESVLTPEECVTLGFAGDIILAAKYKAVAFFDFEINSDTNMSSTWKERVDAAAAKLKNWGIVIPGTPVVATAVVTLPETREAKAVQFETDKGAIETPYPDVMVGDPVTMVEDGSPAPDDTYKAADGTTIIVVGGVVDQLVPVVDGDMQAILIAKDKSIADKDAEILALKETIAAGEQIVVQAEALVTAFDTKSATRSTWTPPAASAHFRGAGGEEVVTGSTLVERRKARKEAEGK